MSAVHELAEARRQERSAYDLMRSLTARIVLTQQAISCPVPSSTTSANSWPTRSARWESHATGLVPTGWAGNALSPSSRLLRADPSASVAGLSASAVSARLA